MTRYLGTIDRLQVQMSRLKPGEGNARRYNPAPIQEVPALRLTPDGVLGLASGQVIVDVHHKQHPDSVNRQDRGNMNGISFNFTSHYRRMENRFGRRAADGFAGENILIASELPFTLDAFRHGMLIESGSQCYLLAQVTVAAPCQPFSRYMLATDEGSVDPGIMRETLQFLNGGTRGFLCHWAEEPITIHVGDKIFLP